MDDFVWLEDSLFMMRAYRPLSLMRYRDRSRFLEFGWFILREPRSALTSGLPRSAKHLGLRWNIKILVHGEIVKRWFIKS
ncbi:Uncharacterized protein HZ326_2041 [Fusarium oxysporum f. sp. albedinis]|nr:Uncharacterized protein HZ326_2041 [Fusarium oxysporum f. sp. albedinis]